MSGNKSKLYFLSLFIIVASLVSSCNERPTDIGSEFLKDTLELYALNSRDSDIIEGFKNAIRRPQSYITGQFFIGNFEETKSIAFIRFGDLPDSLNNLTINDIISAKLSLQPLKYAYGNLENSVQDFNVYDLNRAVRRGTNIDSIKAVGGFDSFINQENGIVANYSGTIELKDTMNPIVMDLSKELMIDWFKFAATGEQTEFSHSLGLVPQSGSNVINKFKAASPGDQNEPTQIEIIYNFKGQLDTLVLKSLISTYFADAPSNIDKGALMQGGIAYYSELHFDLSQIPPFSPIHRAQLELTVDRSRSKFSNLGIDTIISVYYPLKFRGNVLDTVVSYQGRLEAGDKYIFPSISSAVENIIAGDSQKDLELGHGFISLYPDLQGLQLNNMYSFLDRYVFYGTDAENPDHRPVLKIIYSKRPDIKPE